MNQPSPMPNITRLQFLTDYHCKTSFYEAIPSYKWEEWRTACLALKRMYGIGDARSLFSFGRAIDKAQGRRIPDLAQMSRDGSSLYFQICKGLPPNGSPKEERYVADFIYLTSIFLRENMETNLLFSLLGVSNLGMTRREFDLTRLNHIKPYVVTHGESLFNAIDDHQWETWREVCFGVKSLFGFVPMPVRVPLGSFPNRRLPDLARTLVSGREVAARLASLPFDRTKPKEMDYYQAFIDISASFLLLQFENQPEFSIGK